MKDVELVYTPGGISWARSARKGRTLWHAIRKYEMYYHVGRGCVTSLSAVKVCGDVFYVDRIELTTITPEVDVCDKCREWAARRV